MVEKPCYLARTNLLIPPKYEGKPAGNREFGEILMVEYKDREKFLKVDKLNFMILKDQAMWF